MNKSILLDTNIWVYYFDKDSLFHKNSHDLIKTALENNFSIYLTSQILRELLSVLTHKSKVQNPLIPAKAIKKIKYLLNYFPLVQESDSSFVFFLSLVQKYNIHGLAIHDINIVATALDNNISTIVTNNVCDFKKVKELKILGMEDFINEF